MRKDEAPIIVEQKFNASVSRVWDAITTHEEMVRWFFDNIPSFDPVTGFETRFVVKVEDRVYPHLWKLAEVDPPHKIVYDWSYEGYEGKATVMFEVEKDGEGSMLRLTALANESFSQDIPEFKRESGIAGWNYFIGESLKNYIDNN